MGIEETLTNEEKRVLKALEAAGGPAEPEALLEATGLDELVEVMNAASWLEGKGLVRTTEEMHHIYELDDEGRRCLDEQLPERRALRLIHEAGGELAMQELTSHEALAPHERGVAVGQLKDKALIEIDQGTVRLTPEGEAAATGELPEEPILDALRDGGVEDTELEAIHAAGFEHFRQRPHLFKRRDVPVRRVELTPKGQALDIQGLELTEQIAQITPQVLREGTWKTAQVRPYDVQAFAPAAYPGKRHPMRDLIEAIRRIFLEMGFTEIGGDYVRTAFWNLDALFIPQDHPAREMQDTFYLTEPERAPLRGDQPWPDELVDTVKAVHESGGETGSKGWGGTWSEDEASQLLLRTHTTVDTISHLANHPGAPQRVFEVGRVFRNERVDATHLPEFHQVEGIVVEPGANLDMLIGLLRTFYVKMGFEDVRVRPAYFPYTEPSLEVEALYNGEWLELGGAGIFRPEVTEPLGVEHPVLAWGLGLERLAMLVLGLDDIRQLYMSDIDWLRKAPMLW